MLLFFLLELYSIFKYTFYTSISIHACTFEFISKQWMAACVFTGFTMLLEFGMELRSHLHSLSIAGCCHSHDGVKKPVSSLLKRTGPLLRWFQTGGSSRRKEVQWRWMRFNQRLLWGLDHNSGVLCSLGGVAFWVVYFTKTSRCLTRTIQSCAKLIVIATDDMQIFSDVKKKKRFFCINVSWDWK